MRQGRLLKEQPDQVHRMLRATIRSMIYTREHREEALPILQISCRAACYCIPDAYEFIGGKNKYR